MAIQRIEIENNNQAPFLCDNCEEIIFDKAILKQDGINTYLYHLECAEFAEDK